MPIRLIKVTKTTPPFIIVNSTAIIVIRVCVWVFVSDVLNSYSEFKWKLRYRFRSAIAVIRSALLIYEIISKLFWEVRDFLRYKVEDAQVFALPTAKTLYSRNNYRNLREKVVQINRLINYVLHIMRPKLHLLIIACQFRLFRVY